MEGEAQKLSAEPPEVPPPTCTTGGTGWGQASFWEAEGGVQREGSNETAVERLDLKRDVVANCSSSNAPPCQPPVPNGGASATPSNWGCSLQRLEGSNRTRWQEHCRQACRRQGPGGFPTPQGVVLSDLGDTIQTVLPHDGASDFGVSQLICAEAVRGGSPTAASHSS